MSGPTRTSTAPYTLETVYTAGDLRITETNVHTAGTKEFTTTYSFQNTNESTPVRFRATVGGDVKPASVEGGVGFLTGTSPNRSIGTIYHNGGGAMEIEEVTPWDAYMEGTAFEIWRRVQRPFASGSATAGLNNDADELYKGDKGVAVQWDDHLADPGLAAGPPSEFVVRWQYTDYNPLEITVPTLIPTHATATGTAVARDPDGTGADLVNDATFYWQVTGANPKTEVPGPPLVADPSTVEFTWPGTVAGSDGITGFVDLNGDGVRDPNEPVRSAWTYRFDRLTAYAYWSNPVTDYANSVTVSLRDQAYDPMGSTDYTWTVARNGGAPSAPQLGTTDPLTGEDEIPITSSTPGTDVVEIKVDLDLDGTKGNDPGETMSVTIEWDNRIQVYSDDERYQGDTNTSYVYLWTPQGGYVPSGTQIHWELLEGSANRGTATDDEVVTTNCCSSAQMSWTGTNAGRDTLRVWYDADGSGGSDPNAGDPTATVTVDFLVPYTDRLTLQAPNDTSETIGGSTSVAFHLSDHFGNPDGDVPIRYRRTGTANPTAGSGYHLAGTTNSSTGNITINWSDSPASTPRQYDDLFVYADYDADGEIDGNEPAAYAYVYWYGFVDVSAPGWRTLPYTSSATVTIRNQSGDELGSQPYTYSITGPGAGSGGGNTDAFSKTASIPLTGTSAGTTVVTVDSTVDGVPRQGTATQIVEDQLELTPKTQTVATGLQAEVDAYLNFGSNLSSRTYHWSAAGNGSTLSGTVSGSSTDTTPVIQWTRSTPGTDTLTVWTDGTTGTPGVRDSTDPASTATVTWEQALVDVQVDAPHASIGTEHHATATLKNALGAALQDGVLRYYVNGPNPTAGTDGKLAKETDSNGQIDIAWTGTSAGTDYVTVFADDDLDGVKDAGEPSDTATIEWHPRVDTGPVTRPSGYQGNTASVVVTFHDPDYQPMANEQLKYIITGPNGVAAPAVTTNSSGQATITWVGAETGYDVLKVFQDTNGNDQIDNGELTSPDVGVSWWSRLDSYYQASSYNVTTGPVTAHVYVELFTLTGAHQDNATLRWTREGAHPGSGTVNTVANSVNSGYADIAWTASVGGQDVVNVWLDSNNDGDRDSGEPRTTETIYWTNTNFSLTHSGGTSGRAGNAHTINVDLNGGGTGDESQPIKYRVSGANPRAAASAGLTNSSGQASFQYTGYNGGYDYIEVWVDTNGDNDVDTGERRATTSFDWLPMISLSAADTGSRIAGGQVTMTATLLTNAQSATPHAGEPLKWRVTGANPVGATATGLTNSSGVATFVHDSVFSGTDTVTVWHDTTANNTPDANEPTATQTIYWNAPPITLTLAPGNADKYAGQSHSVTATVAGVTIPPGGVPVRWSISGANPSSGTATTNNAGVATITWTGSNGQGGTDTLTAYADVSGASGTRDDYDPQKTATVVWNPLVQVDQTSNFESDVGGVHTEQIRMLDSSGNPLANVDVWYTIAGANPTSSALLARATGAPAPVHQRTDSNGYATISWTGVNAGTDTLDVYYDANGNQVLGETGEPHARKQVLWRAAASSASPVTNGTPTTAGTSQLPPGADIDGLPTPPPPVTGRAVNLAPKSGRVLVRLPGSNKFIDLLDAEQVPVGTVVDVTKGRVSLTSTKDQKGGTQTADFYAGVFKIGQTKAKKPITDLALFGGNFKGCGKPARGGAPHGSIAAGKKRVVRKLWGSGKGQFRTRGRYAAAVLRGTDWETTDRCDGTLVRVRKGVVAVTDLVRKRTVVVRAGKQYFAAARPR